jgi:hypothetical protein
VRHKTWRSIGGNGRLKDISCGLARVAVLFNPKTLPQSKIFVPAIESAASSIGVEALDVQARDRRYRAPGLESFARQPNGGLLLHPSAGKDQHG